MPKLQVFDYKRSLIPSGEEEGKEEDLSSSLGISTAAVIDYPDVLLPASLFQGKVTITIMVNKMLTNTAFNTIESQLAPQIQGVTEQLVFGYTMSARTIKAYQFANIGNEVKSSSINPPNIAYMKAMRFTGYGAQITGIGGKAAYGTIDPTIVALFGIDKLAEKFLANQGTTRDVQARDAFGMDPSVFVLSTGGSGNPDDDIELNFLLPSIVGTIPTGSIVHIWVVGKGAITANKDALVYGNTNNTLSTILRYSIKRYGDKMAFVSAKGKFLNFAAVPAHTSTKTTYDLAPELNVGIKDIHVGVKYKINPTTDVYFIPYDSTAYNIIEKGSVGTTSFPSTVDLLALWTDIKSDSIFQESVNNPTSKCVTGGWIDAKSSGCIFTDTKEASLGYYYNYATGSLLCDTGSFGLCTDLTKTCAPDYDPDLKKDDKWPYSCDPKNPGELSIWDQYKQYFIILGIVFIIIIIVIILLFYFIAKSKKKNKPQRSTYKPMRSSSLKSIRK